MATDRHGSIRQRAYEIWEREGKPNDAHERHWRQAEDEIDAAQAAKPAAKTAKPSTGKAGARKG